MLWEMPWPPTDARRMPARSLGHAPASARERRLAPGAPPCFPDAPPPASAIRPLELPRRAVRPPLAPSHRSSCTAPGHRPSTPCPAAGSLTPGHRSSYCPAWPAPPRRHLLCSRRLLKLLHGTSSSTPRPSCHPGPGPVKPTRYRLHALVRATSVSGAPRLHHDAGRPPVTIVDVRAAPAGHPT
jgi:hypothetical protein